MARVYLIDKPGAAQSQIRIGWVGVSRSTMDYYVLDVLNTVLGGSFTSRLNNNLREEHGYAYGAGSSFDMRQSAGPFVASAGVQSDKTVESLREFFKELDGIRQPVPSDELTRAKNYEALGFPAGFESTVMAANLIQLVVFNCLRRFPSIRAQDSGIRPRKAEGGRAMCSSTSSRSPFQRSRQDEAGRSRIGPVKVVTADDIEVRSAPGRHDALASPRHRFRPCLVCALAAAPRGNSRRHFHVWSRPVTPTEIPGCHQVVLAGDGRLYSPCPDGDHGADHREVREAAVIGEARYSANGEARWRAAQAIARNSARPQVFPVVGGPRNGAETQVDGLGGLITGLTMRAACNGEVQLFDGTTNPRRVKPPPVLPAQRSQRVRFAWQRTPPALDFRLPQAYCHRGAHTRSALLLGLARCQLVTAATRKPDVLRPHLLRT
jgi:hypothetical protein